MSSILHRFSNSFQPLNSFMWNHTLNMLPSMIILILVSFYVWKFSIFLYFFLNKSDQAKLPNCLLVLFKKIIYTTFITHRWKIYWLVSNFSLVFCCYLYKIVLAEVSVAYILTPNFFLLLLIVFPPDSTKKKNETY